MRPPLLVIAFGTVLALAVAGDPLIQKRLLNVAVAPAWGKQDRGPDDSDKDRDKDREEKDRDGDKDHDDKDRDKDKDSDKDQDKDQDKGKDDKDQDKDQDKGEDKNQDKDQDKGGDKNEDKNDDKGGGQDEHPNGETGGGKDEHPGGNDGGGTGEEPPTDGPGQEPPSGGGGEEPPSGGPGEEPPAGGPVEEPPGGSPGEEPPSGGGSGAGDPGGSITDREPAERRSENERDSGDAGRLAGRFDLDDTETFDSDGYLARRGEIIALSNNPALERRAEALGLRVVKRTPLPSLHSTVYRLMVPAGSPVDGIIARLRADEPSGVFDRNHLYDSSATRMENRAASEIPARALVPSGSGITIGLVDTGVDVLNPASNGGLSELRYFVNESKNLPKDLPETHGTAIVSLLASRKGLLPGAQLYVACVFYEDKRGGLLSEASDLVRALDWLMERRAPVINMSLSGPPNAVLKAAVSRALGAGHLIVAAVGNSGPASPPLYPAAYDGVIAVTAVDSNGHVYRRANRGPYVEFAALGVDVVAAAPDGLALYSGTSFASPYVAALAALQYRSLDPQRVLVVKESLRSNAMDLGKPGRDEIYGYGLARPATTISTAAR
jgi:hypothetical protein